MIARTTLAIVFVALTAGCAPSKEKAALDLHNAYGEWEHVATMHGYFDNAAACEDIRRLLEREYSRQYRCRAL